MPKGFETDRIEVLLAMYGHFITSNSNAETTASKVQSNAKLRLSISYISMIFQDLATEELLHWKSAGEEDWYVLTQKGLLRAENEIQARNLSLDQFELAYSRQANVGLIVETDSDYLREAAEQLDELSDLLNKANDVGDMSIDDVGVAKAEVDDLRETIRKPKTRTHYLWQKANEALYWITEKAAGTIVGELAKKALNNIHSFINVFFN